MRVNLLQELLSEKQKIVFFGGAGVSTESGIPDYRSPDGLYSVHRQFGRPPEELLSRGFFLQEPEAFYRFYRERMLHPEAQPNPAHRALARLEEMGKLLAVVTQNIDGLHQKAGSHKVLELHGSVWRNHCMGCGRQVALEELMNIQGVPRCPDCGGLIRPDVVLYGEPLDPDVWDEAVRILQRADLLIIGGTSLAVYPAAGLVDHYQGHDLVVINREDIALGGRPAHVLNESVGTVLETAVRGLRRMR